MRDDDLRRRLKKLEQQAEVRQPRPLGVIVLVESREEARKFTEIKEAGKLGYSAPPGEDNEEFVPFDKFISNLSPLGPDDGGQ